MLQAAVRVNLCIHRGYIGTTEKKIESTSRVEGESCVRQELSFSSLHVSAPVPLDKHRIFRMFVRANGFHMYVTCNLMDRPKMGLVLLFNHESSFRAARGPNKSRQGWRYFNLGHVFLQLPLSVYGAGWRGCAWIVKRSSCNM